MRQVGFYSTGIKECTLPHYDTFTKGLTGQDSSLASNKILDSQKQMYEKHGKRLSSTISGICVPDLFNTYGLTAKDEFIRDMFTPINCHTGKDAIVSYLVANNAYKFIEKDAFTIPQCANNIVFKKGCLIIPRGEILWSLLAYNANKLASGDDPTDVFKIYVDKCGGNIPGDDDLDVEWKIDDDRKYKSHYRFSDPNVAQAVRNRRDLDDHYSQVSPDETKYVYLNPNIYARIKSFRCISPKNKSLVQQDFSLYTMNYYFAQFFAGLSLISSPPKALLMYPPGTLESICPPKADIMVVNLPNSNDIEDLETWTNVEVANEGYRIKGKDKFSVPRNMILIGDCKDMNTCSEPYDNTNFNVIEATERHSMVPVREEYAIFKIVVVENSQLKYFGSNSQLYFKKIIKNSFPNKLSNNTLEISNFTPNCMLTPLGVVSTKNICEGDPLVMKDHTLDMTRIHIMPKTGWRCEIETKSMPGHYDDNSIIDDVSGVLRETDQKNLKYPLNYTANFISSLGTNISILPN
jgi:hypothetical protein